MRRLAPDGGELDRAALARAYAYPADPPRGWWLRVNMVATVDGAGVAANGLTRGISSDADRDLFALMRALCDVVIVGTSTANNERYGPVKVRQTDTGLRTAAGQEPIPPIALVSNRLDLDPDAPLFRAATARTMVFTTASAPAERRQALAEVAEVIVAGDSIVDPKNVVTALADRGYRRMLCEGGPRWLAALLTAGMLDELCLTVSATLLGGEGSRIVRGGVLDAPLELAGLLSDGSDLYLRYRRACER
ncbi:MAG TPA: dihydrofolate reductase family protein [Sporichthyaceae bacterium]